MSQKPSGLRAPSTSKLAQPGTSKAGIPRPGTTQTKAVAAAAKSKQMPKSKSKTVIAGQSKSKTGAGLKAKPSATTITGKGKGKGKAPISVAKQEEGTCLPCEPAKKAFSLPAFSIMKPTTTVNEIEKLKQKTMRRNAPQGEDLKKIKETIRDIKHQRLTAAEFVGLVSPYTGDNGEALRGILAEDLSSFKKLARKVYETMTQDVSDVLTNQHIQLNEYNQERLATLTEKMMRCINEIYSICPDFDFEEYYGNKPRYLALKFPIPKLLEEGSSEIEMHKRQRAYHRLQWLRSEGERLAEENSRLQAHLTELKREQKEEMKKAEQLEAEAEQQRLELEAKEAEMQSKLEILSESMEKTIISGEQQIRVEGDYEAMTSAPPTEKQKKPQRKKKKRPEWASATAADVDDLGVQEVLKTEESVATRESTSGAIKKIKSKPKFKRKKAPPPSEEGSPFHFSPVKTPPRQPPPPKERSPFHYSPVKSPPRVQQKGPSSPFHYSPPRMQQMTKGPPSPFHYSPERTQQLSAPPPAARAPSPAARALSPPPATSSQVLTPVAGASGTAELRNEGLTAARLETTTVTTEERPKFGRRATSGPRDSWRGFH